MNFHTPYIKLDPTCRPPRPTLRIKKLIRNVKKTSGGIYPAHLCCFLLGVRHFLPSSSCRLSDLPSYHVDFLASEPMDSTSCQKKPTLSDLSKLSRAFPLKWNFPLSCAQVVELSSRARGEISNKISNMRAALERTQRPQARSRWTDGCAQQWESSTKF